MQGVISWMRYGDERKLRGTSGSGTGRIREVVGGAYKGDER